MADLIRHLLEVMVIGFLQNVANRRWRIKSAMTQLL